MYYEFSQNNPGGRFVWNEAVRPLVIIEAPSPQRANRRAEAIGLYFDGCASEVDCPCCGDRWDALWEDEPGSRVPQAAGLELDLFLPDSLSRYANVVVYPEQGPIQWAIAPEWDGKTGEVGYPLGGGPRSVAMGEDLKAWLQDQGYRETEHRYGGTWMLRQRAKPSADAEDRIPSPAEFFRRAPGGSEFA